MMAGLGAAGNLCGNLVERGGEHLARPAPRCEEIYEHGNVGAFHFGGELGRRDDLGHD